MRNMDCVLFALARGATRISLEDLKQLRIDYVELKSLAQEKGLIISIDDCSDDPFDTLPETASQNFLRCETTKWRAYRERKIGSFRSITQMRGEAYAQA